MADQDQAAADEQYLQQTLGARYRGCDLDEDGVKFRVTIERRDGKWTTFYAPTPDEALASARFWVTAEEQRWRTSTRNAARAAAAKGTRTATGVSTFTSRSSSSEK